MKAGDSLQEKIIRLKKRKDGFLEVQWKNQVLFDDYLFSKMYEDHNCLLCVRDPNMSNRLYYDMKGYVTLYEYLDRHQFQQGEFLAFLIFLFEDLVRVNVTKPVYLDISYVFLSQDGKCVKFLVIPIQQDGRYRKKEAKRFVEKILRKVKSNEDYETLGVLLNSLKKEEFSFPIVLQDLHALYEREKEKLPWWKRFFHKEKEYVVEEIPQVIMYPEQKKMQIQEETKNYEVQKSISKQNKNNETVVLIQSQIPYLVDVKTKEKIILNKDMFSIGRSPDNDFVLNAKEVSSYHALIQIKKQLIKDLQSSNGTYVNNQKIFEYQLKNSDHIRFANQEYIYYER